MITKFIYGSPMDTGAVVKEIPSSCDDIKYFSADKKENISLTTTLSTEAVVYGLGESVRGINKRGWKYVSFCADDPVHTEGKESLYGAHNFIIISDNATKYGVFVDCPAKVVFDIGYSHLDKLVITAECEDVAVYIIEEKTELEIVKELRALTGKSYIAPLWSFGYQQSRWSYMNADAVRGVAKGYRDNDMPIDAIYLDIDYMEDYKDFTINNERFPEFESFVKEMKEQNIRLVPIIDAGVKIQDGYDVYEEGVKNNYFCKNAEGEDFIAAVWPGLTHFPDFFKADASKWFGSKYKVLTDMGIEGFWNDMNEPAIFYTKKKLDEAWEKINYYKDKNLDINSFFEFRDIFSNLLDYTEFYHDVNGKQVRHDKVHNLYGFYMTKSASEAFDEIIPDKRTLMYSRSSYIGMHRYGGIWTGDNQSWWSQLELSIKQMPSLNMCGFMYVGSDIGGFGSNTTEDLVLRWTGFGVFTPLMRNHAALGTRDQECYRFDNIDMFRNVLKVRYRLVPYLYSEYMKACLNNGMMFKPLAFDYCNDPFAARVEDQLMVGDSIMIAPIYQQNAKGRYVYLPEDMLFVKLSGDEVVCKEAMTKGHHYIDVAMDEVPLFIKKGAILPLCDSALSTEELDMQSLQLIAFGDKAEFDMYTDDGITKQYNTNLTKIKVENETINCDNKDMKLSII
ncbi:MAG: glycoside hydrolase family 31 protein [Acutalibacteraceae bacterium]|nr:glycoside hydrolase family 31 protein [Acutalibacteraceae bacterium]